MASVTLKNIKKLFDKTIVAVDDFSIEIKDKEFLVLVGPSGCGKSTTLRMIAGLEEISGGELYIGDRLVNNVEPKNRNIAMVFQNYALYPHITVYDNIAFGLKMRHMPKNEIDQRVREAAEILEITDLLKRRPKALSGGQRQRVAIGRAIVRQPDVFLMDEPLSNLDAKLRGQMRTEIIKLRRRVNTTFVYVTHDQTEAMTLGDRIVVMNKGIIQQTGTPQEVFNKPVNIFVAGFIGTPQMNFLNGELFSRDGKYHVAIGENDICLEIPSNGKYEERKAVVVGIRPEHIKIGDDCAIPAVIEVTELLGSTADLHLLAEGQELEVVVSSSQSGSILGNLRENGVSPVTKISFDVDSIHVFDPETEERMILSEE